MEWDIIKSQIGRPEKLYTVIFGELNEVMYELMEE